MSLKDRERDICLPLSVIFATVIVFFSGGCRSHVSSDEIVGKWVVQYRESKEELVLSKDGTFEQLLALGQASTPEHRIGKWDLRDGRNEQLVLHGALAIDETTGRIAQDLSRSKDGLSFFPIRRSMGKITLVVNDDLNLRFKKQE